MSYFTKKNLGIITISAAMILAACGCDKSDSKTNADTKTSTASKFLAGQIYIDGSSTVYPITDLAAKSFNKVQPNVWIKVDLSGSGRGISRLLKDEIDIANASRCIKAKEVASASELGISFIELPIAFDGIAVVVNSANDWADSLSVEELKQIWQPDSKVKYWSDIRAEWPKLEIKPCAPTKESGTFDFFTKKICGKSGQIRQDYFAHEDEHVLGPYVTNNKGSIGFFGYGWFQKYSRGLRAVPVANTGAGAVLPNETTISNGSYKPLSRPLFVYINAKAAEKPEVKAFVEHYLGNASKLVAQANYFPLSTDGYKLVNTRFNNTIKGSAFVNGMQGKSIQQILSNNNVMRATVK